MDATQKRRIWKVAIEHFSSTVFCVILFYVTSINWKILFLVLQPHFLIFLVRDPNPAGGLLDAIEIWGCLIAIPVWSYCFGWLYVKLTNWLNHFPVLGKKVF